MEIEAGPVGVNQEEGTRSPMGILVRKDSVVVRSIKHTLHDPEEYED